MCARCGADGSGVNEPESCDGLNKYVLPGGVLSVCSLDTAGIHGLLLAVCVEHLLKLGGVPEQRQQDALQHVVPMAPCTRHHGPNT